MRTLSANSFLGDLACALRRRDCKAEETVMIGDDMLDDVAGAMELGMHGILVKTGAKLVSCDQ